MMLMKFNLIRLLATHASASAKNLQGDALVTCMPNFSSELTKVKPYLFDESGQRIVYAVCRTSQTRQVAKPITGIHFAQW